MDKAILFKSRSNNPYCYCGSKSQFMLCHPLLIFFFFMHQNGTNIESGINEILSKANSPENKQKLANALDYYKRKFSFLMENGYLEEVAHSDKISGRLSPIDLKISLANTHQVTFETTEACNLKCHYCAYGKFYGNYEERQNRNISVRKVKVLLDFLSELWNSPLNLSHNRKIAIGFYGGEPLLNFDFIRDIISYLIKLKCLHNSFSYSMTTNGVLLDKYMDFIVKNDFNLLISLDGSRDHNSYRTFPNGLASYDHIYDNCIRLRSKFPEYFNDKVQFAAVLHNKNSVHEILAYFKEKFNKIPMINELNPVGISPAYIDEFLRTFRNYPDSYFSGSVCENIQEVHHPNFFQAKTIINQYSGYVFKKYVDLLHPKETSYLPTATCIPFSRKIFLSAKGKIYPCERIGHQYSLGNVDYSAVNINFDEIAERYNSYYDKLAIECNKCYGIEHCGQCLFHLDIDANPVVCKRKKDYDLFSMELSSAISFLEEHRDSYTTIMEKSIMV